MRIFVPFDPRRPKTRLGSIFDDDEREAFATAMCRDVCESIEGAGHTPELLATQAVDIDVQTTVDDRSLSTVVNDSLTSVDLPAAVIMADLPLITPATVERLLSTVGDVVLAPGMGGGTNALIVRQPDFRVDYHGGSYRKHRAQARAIDADLAQIDSFRLALDIDEPRHLVEVLLHSDGHATSWLSRNGFEGRNTGGRGTVVRTDPASSNRAE